MKRFLLSLPLLFSAISPLRAASATAYIVPSGTPGGQAFGGPLGLAFDVLSPVEVTELGVFDDGSNGMNLTITARLYDRDTGNQLETISFSPGNDGTPAGGSRFKPLPVARHLAAGFHGMIVAEGYGGGEQNGNTGAPVWTTDAGGGVLSFVGGGYYGFTAGVMPDGADGGPANRYAAGTFKYEYTLPPVITTTPGNGQIQLQWAAVAGVDSYRVSRAGSIGGVMNVIVPATVATSYTDAGLANGTTYCYQVVAVAGGIDAALSLIKCATPFVLTANHHIAYFIASDQTVPFAPAGNQTWPGSLGMEFEVDNPVTVSRIGVFDDGGNGLARPLHARIFDRDTGLVVPGSAMDFTPASPGTLIESMRFKDLPAPLVLPAGFNGVIEADGYGVADGLGGLEANYNAGFSPQITTLSSGGGSLLFVGTSRYGDAGTPGAYPPNPDGGPAARYGAGTFEFVSQAPAYPGRVALSVLAPAEDRAATLTWTASGVLLPAVAFRIYRGDSAAGPFTALTDTAYTSYRDTHLTGGRTYYYTVRAIAANNALSARYSNVVSVLARPFAAFHVQAGTGGGQDYGGSVGMDFDVTANIEVTSLGVFDSGSDGLHQTLTAALYDRNNTATPLALLTFSGVDPGTLVDGSRFKPLGTPLHLGAGFQGTIVAWGYGPGELLYNAGAGPSPLLTAYGGGAINLVGSGRYGAAGVYPDSVDGGPAYHYAAGSFQFVSSVLGPQTIAVQSGAAPETLRIDWTGDGFLESSTTMGAGSWVEIPGAFNGIELLLSPADLRRFFRVRQD